MIDYKNVQPLDDFNWDEFESGSKAGNGEGELTKAYDETLNKIQEHQVVEGTVISIDKKEVVVNIGYKSDGIIPASEFRYNPDLKVGDKVEVYVESQEDKNGQLELSHKKARLQKSWDNINKAMEGDEIIQGYIKSRTKGGMIVDVFGIEAFLPGSQIDVHPIRDYDIFVGKTMEFKVVKINQEFRNVVVSHKALIEAELEAQRKEIISHLEKGQILEGTVKNITTYGVFVDLGGVDGLIHITDLSWGRVSDPHEVVELDQKINVVILDFDQEKKRIALGLKQLTPHPWDSLDQNLKVGDHVKGKVVVMADYGAFVEIQPGVEGLIHVSEMSWSQHLRSAQDFLKVGDEVEAVILTLDRDERKMSLGLKQLKEDPWENIEVKYPVGSKHTAKVRNFTNFGIFVELEEGVDGLIHISDLSWTKKIKHPSEFTKVGETIYKPGTVHIGKITESMDKGAVITLNEGGEGFATPKHLVKEDGTQAQLGEELPFMVIEFVKDSKRIILSHSRTFEDVKDEPRRENNHRGGGRRQQQHQETAQIQNVVAGTSLGDLGVLADLKKRMEEGK
ncbi:MAG: 30S ribosomal protein S1 [Prevotella sp.]|nr:30S ribosomal protein S1 [Prevotella sp.]